jgi:hypothetical protein
MTVYIGHYLILSVTIYTTYSSGIIYICFQSYASFSKIQIIVINSIPQALKTMFLYFFYYINYLDCYDECVLMFDTLLCNTACQ